MTLSFKKLSLGVMTSVVMLGVSFPDFAQAQSNNTPPQSWLDQPLQNWNRPNGNLPQLPSPQPPSNISQCVSQIRQPGLESEKALVAKGWKLFGPLQTYDSTQLFLATSGFDGMCRPLGFQAFVYVEGRYAGTLSPVLMDSRSDGVLYSPMLNNAREITVEYARYRDTDALCCPSGKSFVTFQIRADEVPDLIPLQVETSSNDPDSTSPSPTTLSSLTGIKWQLKKIDNQALPLNPAASNFPYLELDSNKNRYFGSGGCNRFTGGFTVAGNSIQFSPAASTKMACLEENIATTENKMFSAFGRVDRFERVGQTLKLYAGNAVALEFQAMAPN